MAVAIQTCLRNALIGLGYAALVALRNALVAYLIVLQQQLAQAQIAKVEEIIQKNSVNLQLQALQQVLSLFTFVDYLPTENFRACPQLNEWTGNLKAVVSTVTGEAERLIGVANRFARLDVLRDLNDELLQSEQELVNAIIAEIDIILAEMVSGALA